MCEVSYYKVEGDDMEMMDIPIPCVAILNAEYAPSRVTHVNADRMSSVQALLPLVKSAENQTRTSMYWYPFRSIVEQWTLRMLEFLSTEKRKKLFKEQFPLPEDFSDFAMINMMTLVNIKDKPVACALMAHTFEIINVETCLTVGLFCIPTISDLVLVSSNEGVPVVGRIMCQHNPRTDVPEYSLVIPKTRLLHTHPYQVYVEGFRRPRFSSMYRFSPRGSVISDIAIDGALVLMKNAQRGLNAMNTQQGASYDFSMEIYTTLDVLLYLTRKFLFGQSHTNQLMDVDLKRSGEIKVKTTVGNKEREIYNELYKLLDEFCQRKDSDAFIATLMKRMKLFVSNDRK